MVRFDCVDSLDDRDTFDVRAFCGLADLAVLPDVSIKVKNWQS